MNERPRALFSLQGDIGFDQGLETDLLIPSYVTTLSNKFSYATNKGDAVKSQS